LSNNLEEILHRIRESREITPHSVDRCVVTDIIDPIEFGQAQRLGNPINIEKALEVHRENLGEEYSRQFTLTSNPSSDYMFRFRLLPLDVRVKKSGETSVYTPHPMFAGQESLDTTLCDLISKCLPEIECVNDELDLKDRVLQFYVRARSLEFKENRSYTGGFDPQLCPADIVAVANIFVRTNVQSPNTTLQVGLTPSENGEVCESHMIIPILLDHDEFFLETLKCHEIEEGAISVCCGSRTLHRISHKRKDQGSLLILTFFLQNPSIRLDSLSYYALSKFLKGKISTDLINLIATYSDIEPNTFTSSFDGDRSELSHFIRFSRGLPNESIRICEEKCRPSELKHPSLADVFCGFDDLALHV